MLWFVLQLLGRIAFSVWFRLRARGIEKLPKKGGALLLINHQSFLDPLMVGTPLRRPVSYMGRDSLFKIPIVGFVLRNTYVFPINRESASTASMKDAIKRMRHGFLVGIFPEGTRSEDGRIGPLKPGFVSLVRRGKVPVYPVGVAGSREALPKNAWFVYPATIRVVFGDPFTPEEIEQYSRRGQEQRFIELARERISRCQQEAQEWRTGHSMESPAESDLS
jgi:1-acyl-sn-glycerol-3-phosphate acyltransferase